MQLLQLIFGTVKNIASAFHRTKNFITNVLFSFIDEVVKMIPVVRSVCPENMLAHEFEQCSVKYVLVPLRELMTNFATPHKLIQKWREKYADSIRLHNSDPELAQQAKQVFSALNAQLMAELPKGSVLL